MNPVETRRGRVERPGRIDASAEQASERKQLLKDDLEVLADGASQSAISLAERLAPGDPARPRAARPGAESRRAGAAPAPAAVHAEVPGYAFFAYYHAAHEVGGDYYDFVPLPDDRLGIALGDVSGKGVAAALIMAKFSGDTRLNLLAEGSAAAAAARAEHRALRDRHR